MAKNAEDLRREFPYTAPSVIKQGPIFGMGYRSPWQLGNIIQAKLAKKYNLNVMLAQQSAREIERTGRSFREVVDCATISSYEANLTTPWGADGDHLRNEEELKAAIAAGCTHFTYDVTAELKKGLKEAVDKICVLYRLTNRLKPEGDFTCEASLDETEKTTELEDIVFVLEELKKQQVKVDEIAPRFPGYFEKGIDYYLKEENGRKIRDMDEFEKYLEEISKLAREFNFRISVHSGSDKFLIYPIISRVLKDNFRLKTAGTYYVEEMKIIARNDAGFFRKIYDFSLRQFQKDRATYELSANLANIPDISKLGGEELASLLQSGSGNDDLRQVVHVTYGSVLTAKNEDGTFIFVDRCARILKENEEELFAEMDSHIKKHVMYMAEIN